MHFTRTALLTILAAIPLAAAAPTPWDGGDALVFPLYLLTFQSADLTAFLAIPVPEVMHLVAMWATTTAMESATLLGALTCLMLSWEMALLTFSALTFLMVSQEEEALPCLLLTLSLETLEMLELRIPVSHEVEMEVTSELLHPLHISSTLLITIYYQGSFIMENTARVPVEVEVDLREVLLTAELGETPQGATLTTIMSAVSHSSRLSLVSSLN